MRNTTQTALALILAGTFATGAFAQTEGDAAVVPQGQNQTGSDAAGGNAASEPATAQTGTAADQNLQPAADQTGNSYVGGDPATTQPTDNNGQAADKGLAPVPGQVGNMYVGGNPAMAPASDIVTAINTANEDKVADKIAGIGATSDVQVVSLTALTKAQNIDISVLNDALAKQNASLPTVQGTIASNPAVSEALKSLGFGADKVVAVAKGMGNSVIFVVDDRT